MKKLPRQRSAGGLGISSVRFLVKLALWTVFSATAAGAEDSLPGRSFIASSVDDRAFRLARQQALPTAQLSPQSLPELDYDDYRRIVFDPERSVWRDDGLDFQLQLFHPGYLFTRTVEINLIETGRVEPLEFSTELFAYDAVLRPEAAEVFTGFPGFRVHYPINEPGRIEEFLVFLGASYFRAVGRDQFYGLSARGLAINTVGSDTEEFPRFTEFWIERPEPGSDQIVIHALLQSQSVTGAFHFKVAPGAFTRIDVEANLFPRVDLERVGIAPLTSMFQFDATNRNRFDDFRSAVHDSEGLLIAQANGERVWRPLTNPRVLQVSSFAAGLPAGFGLMQRQNGFGDFNDAEARYDKRPSLWIEPQSDWGAGSLVLVEIPSAGEAMDNIVAYWQPESGLRAGRSYQFSYRMLWGPETPGSPEAGRVMATASGATGAGGGERVFVIDFSTDDVTRPILTDPDSVLIRAITTAGKISDVSGTVLDTNGHYRAYIKFVPGQVELAELRVALEASGRQLGETWLYRWTR